MTALKLYLFIFNLQNIVETLEDGLIHGTLDKMTFFWLFVVAIGGKVE